MPLLRPRCVDNRLASNFPSINTRSIFLQRCLSPQTVGTGELQTGSDNWSRYDHYAAYVHTLTVRVDGSYRNWVFLLPIKRLAATRQQVKTTIDDQLLDYLPPLLPNLVSLTFELQYSQYLDHAIAVLAAPGTQLLGVEALAGLLLLMPPTLRHLTIAWRNNSISDLFTSILDEFVHGLATPASRMDFHLGLVGADYAFLNTLPGDYLTTIPRSASLVSFHGFSASAYMFEVLSGLPLLSDIYLYHMPGHEPIPFAQEYIPRLVDHPSYSSTPFPCLNKLRILACHNVVDDMCRILSHFPVEQLHCLELEFSQAYDPPAGNIMEPLFALVGNRGHALRAFSLVFDAEKWDYIPPRWDVESGVYALAPWPSISHLLSCHELESVVIKCAGVYHGLTLSHENARALGAAWPHLTRLCVSETLLGVDVVKQSIRPRLVDMSGLAELALALPSLTSLHITLEVDHASTFENLITSAIRPASLPLDLDLGYSPLVGDVAETVARYGIHFAG